MVRPIGGVDPDLGGWEGEDEPPLAGVDVAPAEHVAEHVSDGVGFGGVQHHVSTVDRHGPMLPYGRGRCPEDGRAGVPASTPAIASPGARARLRPTARAVAE